MDKSGIDETVESAEYPIEALLQADPDDTPWSEEQIQEWLQEYGVEVEQL